MKNLCLVGAGRMGAMHAASFAGHPQVRLAVVADISTEAAESLAQRMGAEGTADIDAAINRADVDGVMIATSTDTHVDVIERCIAAKKPIFCEKPVDLDIGRVDRCLAALKESGLPFQLGFNRRFDPSFAALSERLRAGEVGKLELVKITSRDPMPPPMDYVKVSGGLFRDMTIHDFDMARWLLNEEPVAVSAHASNLVDPAIGEAGDIDTALTTLKTASGVLCNIDNSRRAVYGYDQRVEVLGSNGMLQAENPTPNTVVHSSTDTIAGGCLFDFGPQRYAESYRRELNHFADVLNGADPHPNANDGRRALLLANAALESLKTGRIVQLEK